jgi:hypothetical protein
MYLSPVMSMVAVMTVVVMVTVVTELWTKMRAKL